MQYNLKFVRKAKFYKKIDSTFSQCLTCERRCRIAINQIGHCRTRINLNGNIKTLVYGLIPALSYNPIEKKPLFHFHPGSKAITIGTYGCNFDCFWCQNYHLSKESPIEKKSDIYITPHEIIELANENHCQGTSISFNEPTLLFEYSLEVFRLAKKEGLYNTYVTNGYMTENVLKELINSGLDAMNIDIKGGPKMVKKYCGADIELILRNAKYAKKAGVHIEITTLLIENYNSDKDTVKWIAKTILDELGADTPFHITRFFPQYKSKDFGLNKPTSIENMEES